MADPLFIALEGIDGSGKSTQARIITEKLLSLGKKVHLTTEPTDSPIGKLIRDIFNHRLDADQRTIAGLFVADRLEHLLNRKNGILKKLEEGYHVITDRYYFSSYAYHGVYMSMDWVIQANSLSAEIKRPDINIFIDITPEVAIERLKNERKTLEIFETLENLRKVRDKYFEAFEKLKHVEKIVIINGEQSVKEVSERILDLLLHHSENTSF